MSEKFEDVMRVTANCVISSASEYADKQLTAAGIRDRLTELLPQLQAAENARDRPWHDSLLQELISLGAWGLVRPKQARKTND